MNKFESFFIRFLKDNDCFLKFFRNVEKQKRMNEYRRAIFNNYMTIIDYTLCWQRTDEGFEFWKQKNMEFEDFFACHFKKINKK